MAYATHVTLNEGRMAMRYETPRLTSLGSIANHTYVSFPPKGGRPPDAHLDQHCEWSGGSGENWPGCSLDTPINPKGDDRG